jgi:SpoIID/LytB domain protein
MGRFGRCAHAYHVQSARATKLSEVTEYYGIVVDNENGFRHESLRGPALNEAVEGAVRPPSDAGIRVDENGSAFTANPPTDRTLESCATHPDICGMSRSVISRREFVIIAAGSVMSACSVSSPRVPLAAGPSAPGRVKVRRGGRIETVPLEDYVLGSVLAEVSPVNEAPVTVARIFEVQAVLARSFAAANVGRHGAEGFDLCDTSHCQMYDPARVRTSRFAVPATDAVRRTAGILLVYGHRTADAFFHADCGGHTAAADAIWGGSPVPYLHPMTDDVRSGTHRRWRLQVTTEQARQILNADRRTQAGTWLRGIEVRQRDVSGRALEIAILGTEPRIVRGEDLRAILNRRLGDRAIQSTRFSVRASGGQVLFEGTGFGHGVGLCQVGAAARARRGESLEQIVAAYYQGVQLGRVKA